MKSENEKKWNVMKATRTVLKNKCINATEWSRKKRTENSTGLISNNIMNINTAIMCL